MKIVLEDKKVKTQIPYTTKVILKSITKERENFVIDEGQLKGKPASVRKKLDGTSFLLSNIQPGPSANVLFMRASKKLRIEGLGEFLAETWDKDPVPPGLHDLEIPSAPHTERGGHYLNDSKYAETWFRIGHHGGRFLHCGETSAGCITVKERKKWTDIFHFLINRRKDDTSVGTVTTSPQSGELDGHERPNGPPGLVHLKIDHLPRFHGLPAVVD